MLDAVLVIAVIACAAFFSWCWFSGALRGKVTDCACGVDCGPAEQSRCAKLTEDEKGGTHGT